LITPQWRWFQSSFCCGGRNFCDNVPADGKLIIKKGRKFMFGTGVMDGLSSLTIILMAVAGAIY